MASGRSRKSIHWWRLVQEGLSLSIEGIGGVWEDLVIGAKIGINLYGRPYGLYGPYGHGWPKTQHSTIWAHFGLCRNRAQSVRTNPNPYTPMKKAWVTRQEEWRVELSKSERSIWHIKDALGSNQEGAFPSSPHSLNLSQVFSPQPAHDRLSKTMHASASHWPSMWSLRTKYFKNRLLPLLTSHACYDLGFLLFLACISYLKPCNVDCKLKLRESLFFIYIWLLNL